MSTNTEYISPEVGINPNAVELGTADTIRMAPKGFVRLVLLTSPFRNERREYLAPVGTTLRELVEDALHRELDPERDHIIVMAGDNILSLEEALKYSPADGEAVFMRVIPGGLDGLIYAIIALSVISAGLTIVGAITGNQALMYAGMAVGMLALAGGAIGAAAGIGGIGGTAGMAATTTIAGAEITLGQTMAIGGLIMGAGNLIGGFLAPQPGVPDSGGLEKSPYLTGTANAYRPYEPIPSTFGRVNWSPPNGALQFTEIISTSDAWLKALFCLGYGPLDIDLSSVRIGNTLLTTQAEEEEGTEIIQVEARHGYDNEPPTTLYPAAVVPIGVAEVLAKKPGGYPGENITKGGASSQGGTPDHSPYRDTRTFTGLVKGAVAKGATTLTIEAGDNFSSSYPTSIVWLPLGSVGSWSDGLFMFIEPGDTISVQLEDKNWQDVEVTSMQEIVSVGSEYTTDPEANSYRVITFEPGLDEISPSGSNVAMFGTRWATRTTAPDCTEYTVTLHNPTGFWYMTKKGKRYGRFVNPMVWHRKHLADGSGYERWVAVSAAGQSGDAAEDHPYTNFSWGAQDTSSDSLIFANAEWIGAGTSTMKRGYYGNNNYGTHPSEDHNFRGRCLKWSGEQTESSFADFKIKNLEPGVYDVRVGLCGYDVEYSSDRAQGDVNWTGFRSKSEEQSLLTTQAVAQMALYHKSTDIRSGQVDNLTVTTTRLLPFYTKGDGFQNGYWSDTVKRTAAAQIQKPEEGAATSVTCFTNITSLTVSHSKQGTNAVGVTQSGWLDGMDFEYTTLSNAPLNPGETFSAPIRSVENTTTEVHPSEADHVNSTLDFKKYIKNAETTLNGSHSIGDFVLTLASTTGFVAGLTVGIVVSQFGSGGFKHARKVHKTIVQAVDAGANQITIQNELEVAVSSGAEVIASDGYFFETYIGALAQGGEATGLTANQSYEVAPDLETVLTFTAAAAQPYIKIASTAGIAIGDSVSVTGDVTDTEAVVILIAPTTLQLSENLAGVAASGNTVAIATGRILKLKGHTAIQTSHIVEPTFLGRITGEIRFVGSRPPMVGIGLTDGTHDHFIRFTGEGIGWDSSSGNSGSAYSTATGGVGTIAQGNHFASGSSYLTIEAPIDQAGFTLKQDVVGTEWLTEANGATQSDYHGAPFEPPMDKWLGFSIDLFFMLWWSKYGPDGSAPGLPSNRPQFTERSQAFEELQNGGRAHGGTPIWKLFFFHYNETDPSTSTSETWWRNIRVSDEAQVLVLSKNILPSHQSGGVKYLPTYSVVQNPTSSTNLGIAEMKKGTPVRIEIGADEDAVTLWHRTTLTSDPAFTSYDFYMPDRYTLHLADALPLSGVSDNMRVEVDNDVFMSRSPAWAFAEVLRGNGQPDPIDDEFIDGDRLADWHAMTVDPAGDGSQPRMYFDTVVDFNTTTFELLSRIASSARASIHVRDGRIGVVFDRDRSDESPSQMITPRNTRRWSYGSASSFPNHPHGYRVKYQSYDGTSAEHVIYAAGYAAADDLEVDPPLQKAIRFENIEAWGISDAAQAYAYGKYYISQIERRNEVVGVEVDLEHAMCERGDIVLLAHDLDITGLAFGRIKTINPSAVLSYSSGVIAAIAGQDGAGGVSSSISYLDSGDTVLLSGNTYKYDTRSFTIADGSRLQFDFRADNFEAELSGIGLMGPGGGYGSSTWKLFGTRATGIDTYESLYDSAVTLDGTTITESDWVSYDIDLSSYDDGTTSYNLIFIHDHDAATSETEAATSAFRNVRITSGVASVGLDNEITFSATPELVAAYRMRVRQSSTGTIPTSYVLTHPNSGNEVTTSTLTLTTPMAFVDGPQIGDVIVFGTSEVQARRMIVTAILPKADLTAGIAMTPEASEIFSIDLADAGFTATMNGPLDLRASGIKHITDYKLRPAYELTLSDMSGTFPVAAAGVVANCWIGGATGLVEAFDSPVITITAVTGGFNWDNSASSTLYISAPGTGVATIDSLVEVYVQRLSTYKILPSGEIRLGPNHAAVLLSDVPFTVSGGMTVSFEYRGEGKPGFAGIGLTDDVTGGSTAKLPSLYKVWGFDQYNPASHGYTTGHPKDWDGNVAIMGTGGDPNPPYSDVTAGGEPEGSWQSFSIRVDNFKVSSDDTYYLVLLHSDWYGHDTNWETAKSWFRDIRVSSFTRPTQNFFQSETGPKAPKIVSVSEDFNATTGARPLIVSVRAADTDVVVVSQFEVQWRPHGQAVWGASAIIPASGGSATARMGDLTGYFENAYDNFQYDVRARSVRADSLITSRWAKVTGVLSSNALAAEFKEVTITHLEVDGRGNENTFITGSPTFTWETTLSVDVPGPVQAAFADLLSGLSEAFYDSGITSCTVQMWDDTDGTLLREEVVEGGSNGSGSYQYTIEKNLADHNGDHATRRLRCVVRGNLETEIGVAMSLSVVNAIPPAPAITSISQDKNGILISTELSQGLQADVDGIIVWASDTSPFTPSEALRVYSGSTTQLQVSRIPAPAPRTWYFRSAHYDVFSINSGDIDSELNASAETPFLVRAPIDLTDPTNVWPDPTFALSAKYDSGISSYATVIDHGLEIADPVGLTYPDGLQEAGKTGWIVRSGDDYISADAGENFLSFSVDKSWTWEEESAHLVYLDDDPADPVPSEVKDGATFTHVGTGGDGTARQYRFIYRKRLAPSPLYNQAWIVLEDSPVPYNMTGGNPGFSAGDTITIGSEGNISAKTTLFRQTGGRNVFVPSQTGPIDDPAGAMGLVTNAGGSAFDGKAVNIYMDNGTIFETTVVSITVDYSHYGDILYLADALPSQLSADSTITATDASVQATISVSIEGGVSNNILQRPGNAGGNQGQTFLIFPRFESAFGFIGDKADPELSAFDLPSDAQVFSVIPGDKWSVEYKYAWSRAFGALTGHPGSTSIYSVPVVWECTALLWDGSGKLVGRTAHGENLITETAETANTDSITGTPTGDGAPVPGSVKIASGFHHGLSLNADGSIVAWGNDDDGQVSNAPTGTGYTAIAGGNAHSLALAADGSIVSWGNDTYDQVTDTPTGTGYTAIAGGGLHSLALAADGSIVSWGRDYYDQVSNTPTGTGFTAIAGGNDHSLALKADGSIVSWGEDWGGVVSDTPTGTGYTAIAGGGFHSLALAADGSIVVWGQDNYDQTSDTPTATGFTAIAGGGFHSLALAADGSIAAWGADNHDQITDTPTGTGFTSISGGYHYSVALTAVVSIVSWGQDNYDQITDTPTASGSGFTAIAGGGKHSVAMASDGSLVSWGRDDNGQIADTPTETGFTAIACGFYHSLALTADGSIVSWGLNVFGLVSDTPTGTGFTAIAGGYAHSLALAADGSIVSWGLDTYDLIPDTPTGTGFTAIAAGRFHSLALAADGSIVVWGWDRWEEVVTDTPTETGFTAIAGGGFHSLALKADGSIVSWGEDIEDQVTDTPTGTGYTAIAAGTYHCMALAANGSIATWGFDYHVHDSSVPHDTGYTAIAGGSYHSLALAGDGSIADDGSIIAWGDDWLVDHGIKLAAYPSIPDPYPEKANSIHAHFTMDDGTEFSSSIDKSEYDSAEKLTIEFPDFPSTISAGAEVRLNRYYEEFGPTSGFDSSTAGIARAELTPSSAMDDAGTWLSAEGEISIPRYALQLSNRWRTSNQVTVDKMAIAFCGYQHSKFENYYNHFPPVTLSGTQSGTTLSITGVEDYIDEDYGGTSAHESGYGFQVGRPVTVTTSGDTLYTTVSSFDIVADTLTLADALPAATVNGVSQISPMPFDRVESMSATGDAGEIGRYIDQILIRPVQKERHLATDSVSTVKIQSSAVTTDKITDDAVSTVKMLDDAVTERQTGTSTINKYAGTVPIAMVEFQIQHYEDVDVTVTWTGQVYKVSTHATNAFAPLFRIDRYQPLDILQYALSVGASSGDFTTMYSQVYLEVGDVVSFSTQYAQHSYHTVTAVDTNDTGFSFTPTIPRAIPQYGSIRKIHSTPMNVRGEPYDGPNVKRAFSFTTTERNVPASALATSYWYRFMLWHDGNSIWQNSYISIGATYDLTVVKK